MKSVRIFISSPNDVRDERQKARQVIEGLQRQFPALELIPVFWEDLALPATASFQETIDYFLQKRPVDIAIFILWTRLGSALGPATRRRDGTSYVSGTEREFDLMLEAFEQSGRERPVILAYARDDELGFRHSLSKCEAGKLEEAIRQRKLAESFIREHFQDAAGRNLRAYHSYPEPVSFAQRLHTHLSHVLTEFLDVADSRRWFDDPYRGLEVFDIHHSPIFHGRDDSLCEVLLRLRQQHDAGCGFVVVVGASGAGKSSLARAGVGGMLTSRSYDDDVREWRTVTFLPGINGDNLCLNLVRNLAAELPELNVDSTSIEHVASALTRDAETAVNLALRPALAQASKNAGGPVRVLLLVDQMEELWTDRRISDESRSQFLGVLESLAKTRNVWIVATLRSDFYAQAQREPAFLRLKGLHGHFDLVPPDAHSLQRIVVEPARMAGIEFEYKATTGRSLDQMILHEAARDSASLPLLQYALSELYRRRDDSKRMLTFAAYEEIGGVEGALGLRVAETVKRMPAPVRATLHEAFALLVTIDIRGEQNAVRRRAPLEELCDRPERKQLVETLVAARFLTTDRKGDMPVVTIAHEALLRRWAELAEWVFQNREHLRMRARVEQSHNQWLQAKRDRSLLLPPGLALEEGQTLLRDAPHILTDELQEYVVASVHQRDAEFRRQRRIQRFALATSLVAAVIFMVAAFWINKERSQAVTARNQETEARRDLTMQAYDNAIAIAEREITENHDIEKAGALLMGETCPAELRGWEWNYLMRLRDGEGASLVGHQTGLWNAEFSPDGKSIATCSIDGTLKLWDAETSELRYSVDADAIGVDRRLLDVIGVPRIPIMCLSFSPDGKRIATGSFQPSAKFDPFKSLLPTVDRDSPGLVRIWDVEAGKLVGSFQDQKGVVLSVTYSPDGKHIASSSINPDNSFAIWDAETRQLIKRVTGHQTHIHRLRYSHDGKILAAGETNGTIILWDAETFAEIAKIRAHAAPVTGIDFSPETGARIASASQDGVVRVWEASTGKRVLNLEGHAGAAFDVRFSPDGKRIASSGFDKTVRLWDAETGLPKITLRGHKELVWGISFSPDGYKLVSASYDNTARIWDATWNAGQATGHRLAIGGIAERVNHAIESGDSKTLISGGWDNEVRLWNGATGESLGSLKGHEGAIWCVATSKDGKRIASASWDHKARIWDRVTGKVLVEFTEHTAPVHSVAFSPDETLVATGAFDGQLKVWDASSGRLVANCDGFIFPVMSAVFSPNGKYLASGGSDRNLRIWDARSGRSLLKLPGHSASIHQVAFSPDGNYVASACWDHTVRIWDVRLDGAAAEKRELLVFRHHSDRVNGVCFFPDGERVASVGEDKTVRIWNVKSGEELVAPLRLRAMGWTVKVSDDSRRLLCTCWDKERSIIGWDLHELLRTPASPSVENDEASAKK